MNIAGSQNMLFTLGTQKYRAGFFCVSLAELKWCLVWPVLDNSNRFSRFKFFNNTQANMRSLERSIAWNRPTVTHTTLYHKICTAYLHCMAQHLDSCRHTFRPSRQRQAAMKFYLWLVNFPDVSKMAYRTVNRFADEDGVATTARFYGVLMRWWCRMRCTQGPTIHRWRYQSIMLVKFRTEQWSLA